AFRGARIVLEAALEQASDGALRRSDGSVQEKDSPLGTIAHRGGLEHLDQFHQGDVEAEYGVSAIAQRIVEEVVVDDLLLVLRVPGSAEGDDHVVETLEGVAGDVRVLDDEPEVVDQAPLPVEVVIFR